MTATSILTVTFGFTTRVTAVMICICQRTRPAQLIMFGAHSSRPHYRDLTTTYLLAEVGLFLLKKRENEKPLLRY